MTERERLLAVLDGKTPDRTPWYGDLSWWQHGKRKAGKLPAEFAGGDEGYLRMHRDAGVGIYLYPPPVWTERYDETVGVNTSTEGDRHITTLVTPLGSLRSVIQDLPESATGALVEHYVKRVEDLSVMRYIFQHRKFGPNYAAFRQCDHGWDCWGLPVASAPVCTTALQSLLTRWAGVSMTVNLLVDAPDEVARTLAAIQESDDEIFRILCEGPERCVEFPENMSGEVTGRNLIREYELPYWQQRIGQLHGAGKLVGIHNDGTLRASLPLLIEAGFDFVEAATPAPVGDMTIREIRDMTAGRIIVWGGMPGAMFSPLCREEDFVRHTREVLDTYPPGSGFVLGVADQVPPDAEFERICLVRKLVERTLL